jgi:hypothetical protein
MTNIWPTITWDVARAGGFVAYVLVTASVAMGLALSLRWYSRSWPRWATTDLHRHVTLLAIVFTGVHTLAVWLDPFMAFGPAEVLVPLASHYRPIWMALGIVAAYLLIAIWLSERIQRLVGYPWWRRLHYLTFGIYGLVTIHGLAMGSDTRTIWGLAIYGGSAVLVGGLLTIRLMLPGRRGTAHPRVAAWSAFALLAAIVFTVWGPMQPEWNAFANNGNGSGARIALGGGGVSSAPSGLHLPFSAHLQGTVSQSNGGFGPGGNDVTVQMVTTLSGGAQGSLQIALQGTPMPNGGLAIDRTRVSLNAGSPATVYSGQLVTLDVNHFVAVLSDAAGTRVRLDAQMQVDNAGNLSGTVQGGTSASLTP